MKRPTTDLLRDFLERNVRDQVLKWDEDAYFPAPAFQQLHKLGVLQLGMPLKFNGAGSSMEQLLEVHALISEYSPGMTSSLMANLAAQTALSRFAPENLAAQILADQAASGKLMSFCATEKSGTDIKRMETCADKVRNGYLLSGEKMYITNSPSADHFVVLARMKTLDSLGAFYVPAHSPGITISSPLKKLGHNESETAHIRFDKVRLPSTYLLKTDGLTALEVCISRTKALLAGSAVGICQAAKDLATQYLSSTHRYGRPLIELPELRSHLAHLQVQMEAALALAQKAGRVWDKNGASLVESSSAKYFAANAAMEYVTSAIELCGASGYMAESRLSKLFRDAKLLQIYEGASHVQLAIISRHLFKRVQINPLKLAS